MKIIFYFQREILSCILCIYDAKNPTLITKQVPMFQFSTLYPTEVTTAGMRKELTFSLWPPFLLLRNQTWAAVIYFYLYRFICSFFAAWVFSGTCPRESFLHHLPPPTLPLKTRSMLHWSSIPFSTRRWSCFHTEDWVVVFQMLSGHLLHVPSESPPVHYI
jgi:hypothetical protein